MMFSILGWCFIHHTSTLKLHGSSGDEPEDLHEEDDGRAADPPSFRAKKLGHLGSRIEIRRSGPVIPTTLSRGGVSAQ